MSLLYVVDGYNFINHPAYNRANLGMRDERLQLADFIRRNRLTGSPKNKIILVFDGYPPNQLPDHNDNIEIIFSRDVSADEKIIRLIEKSSNVKNIIVVSDDKQIKFIVKSLGARACGIDEFVNAKKKLRPKEDTQNTKLTYTQMHEITQELKNIWLK
ncbi:MAG: hypothetical protein A3K83_00935 [Omnitrophica WOR_2 bacterium RBG_13_44_8b]|nr:MAG: hypothetical protein A3K83_00935 [Omnitrophica WOR_2 bacterium RBG_13_44_8b]